MALDAQTARRPQRPVSRASPSSLWRGRWRNINFGAATENDHLSFKFAGRRQLLTPRRPGGTYGGGLMALLTPKALKTASSTSSSTSFFFSFFLFLFIYFLRFSLLFFSSCVVLSNWSCVRCNRRSRIGRKRGTRRRKRKEKELEEQEERMWRFRSRFQEGMENCPIFPFTLIQEEKEERE